MGPGGRAVVAASAIKVFVTRPARRLYNNLDAPIKPLILAAVKSLKADTAPQGSKGLTAAYSGFMSLKVTSPGGEYRVIYKIVSANFVVVIYVGPRENIYKLAEPYRKQFRVEPREGRVAKLGALSIEDLSSVAENVMEARGLAGRTLVLPTGHVDSPEYQEAIRPIIAWASGVAGHYVNVYASDRSLDAEGGAQAMVTGTGSIVTRPVTTELTILHELAHLMCGERGHTKAFVETAHRLYAAHLGDEAAEAYWRVMSPALGARLRAEANVVEDRYGTRANVIGTPGQGDRIFYNRDTDTLIFTDDLAPAGGPVYVGGSSSNGAYMDYANGELSPGSGSIAPSAQTVYNPLFIEALERLVDTFPEFGRKPLYESSVGGKYNAPRRISSAWDFLRSVNEIRAEYATQHGAARLAAQTRTTESVYDTETYRLRQHAKILNLEECGTLARTILTDAGFPHGDEAYAVPHPKSENTSCVAWAMDGYAVPLVALGYNMRDDLTVVHECAHIIRNGPSYAGRQGDMTIAHDDEWFDTFHRLLVRYTHPKLWRSFEWEFGLTPGSGREAKTASGNVIYRGLNVQFPAEIRRQIDALLAPPLDEDQIDQEQGVARLVVEWLQANHWEAGSGLGRHWTGTKSVAESVQGPGVTVVLTGTYDPAGVDPERTQTGGVWADEDETTLRPGARVTITNVELPGYYGAPKGVPLIAGPIQATASGTVRLWRGLQVADADDAELEAIRRDPAAFARQHLNDPLGIHWTDDPSSAWNFAQGRDSEGWASESWGDDEGGVWSVGLVLEAEVPASGLLQRGTQEHDDYSMSDAIIDYGIEREVTVRDGTMVQLTSVTVVATNDDGSDVEFHAGLGLTKRAWNTNGITLPGSRSRVLPARSASGSCSCDTGPGTPQGDLSHACRTHSRMGTVLDQSGLHRVGGRSPAPDDPRYHSGRTALRGLPVHLDEHVGGPLDSLVASRGGTSCGIHPNTESQGRTQTEVLFPRSLSTPGSQFRSPEDPSLTTIAWNSNGITLFHGTIGYYADQVLAEGLKPRNATGVANHWSEQAASYEGRVYLSHDSRMTVSRSAMQKARETLIERLYPQLAELDAKVWKLRPDSYYGRGVTPEYEQEREKLIALRAQIEADPRLESVILAVTIPPSGWGNLEPDEDTKSYTDKTTELTGFPEWMSSLGSDAVVAYRGEIPASWIKVQARGQAANQAGMYSPEGDDWRR